jgi:hypothetical protein
MAPMNLAAHESPTTELDLTGRGLGPWAILGTAEHSPAPSPSPEPAVLPDPPAPQSARERILALQRSVGNRGVAAMIQRLQPADVPNAQQPGGDISSRAEEEAAIYTAALRRANARRLLPEEVDEVATMQALDRPVGPGLVLGPGTRKLLAAVDGLGKKYRVGTTAGYKRDPASEGGLPVFVSGDPDNPDGRIAVTADGLLEVMKKTTTQPKGTKGKPAPPPVVTHETALLDLQGTRITFAAREDIAGAILAQERSKEERAVQERVLTVLKASDAQVAGGPADAGWTLGALVTAVTSNEYFQVSYLNKKKGIQSELLKDVIAAMDTLRAEFASFKAPTLAATTPGGSVPSHEAFARAFAEKLQPTLFLAASAAQSQLDLSTAAKAAADAEAASAKAALAVLKARKGVPKAEQDAHKQAVKEAATKYSAADSAAKAAKSEMGEDKARLAGLVQEREKFANTILWILDPAKTTEQRAAASAGSLCNVLSYFLYGKAVGVVPPDMDFRDYYLAEVKAARVRYYVGRDAVGVFWGEGSTWWVEQRDLIRMEDPDLKAPRKEGDPPPVIDRMTHSTRRAELDAFLASGANVALTWQDLKNPMPREPHHFLLIVKGPDGVWRNLDHVTTDWRRRGAMTEWDRVFRIETDRRLIEEAKRKLAETGTPVPATPSR